MRLSISNFTKIKKADILIDGITVIAGENNTGKSTIGKILFSLFNSMNDIEEKIREQRAKEIEEACRVMLRSRVMTKLERITFAKIARDIIDENDIEKIDKDAIYYIIETSANWIIKHSLLEKNTEEVLEQLVEKIISILEVPEKKLILEVLTRYFGTVFYKQINSLVSNEKDAELELEIKGRTINLVFSNHECVECNRDVLLMHKALYIDNPFLVDKLRTYGELNPIEKLLKDLLTEDNEKDVMDGIIESVLVKEKLEAIYDVLGNVVEGNILKKQNDEYYLEQKDFQEPILLNNLSTGLKAFVLLKMLLEKGCLKEKDVLILDEPEIHLHPQWQIAYAELIVLLQKYFDLSIVVATHSPYFLDAINLYSVKHGIDNKVNYYLSSMSNNCVEMELVTKEIDKIYKKMATPIQALNTLRHELNHS